MNENVVFERLKEVNLTLVAKVLMVFLNLDFYYSFYIRRCESNEKLFFRLKTSKSGSGRLTGRLRHRRPKILRASS